MNNNVLDLTAISVGFDLRAEDVPAAADLDAGLSGLRCDGRQAGAIVELDFWDAAAVGATATDQGYRLLWSWPSHEKTMRDWCARIVVLATGEPVLEMRDPNDNARARYQYLAIEGLLLLRVLPADADRWADQEGDPPWEDVDVRALRAARPSLLQDWLAACCR